jgi:hypothetical protein
MRKVAWLALAPLLMANQITPGEYKVAKQFIALVQQHRLAAAKRMLAPKTVIKSWDSDAHKSFQSFAAYIVRCPVHDFKGVATKEAHAINVNLDCPGDHSASLDFKNGRIVGIQYGPPPVIIRVSTAPPENQ